MNREAITEWIEALEGGEYKQGKHLLRAYKTDAYCCLGVACDLSGGTWVKDTDDTGLIGYSYIAGGGYSSMKAMPKSVAAHLGILDHPACTKTHFHHHGEVDILIPDEVVYRVTGDEYFSNPATNRGQHYVSGLNDRGVSFEHIAKILRIVLLGEEA